jgi:hypothetical protein
VSLVIQYQDGPPNQASSSEELKEAKPKHAG